MRGDYNVFYGRADQNPDPVGFGGQWGSYSDLETGLVLMTHRYYDSGKGRFLSRDPIGYGGGINLYGYAGNNPVTGSDPSGYVDVRQFLIDHLPFGGLFRMNDRVHEMRANRQAYYDSLSENTDAQRREVQGWYKNDQDTGSLIPDVASAGVAGMVRGRPSAPNLSFGRALTRDGWLTNGKYIVNRNSMAIHVSGASRDIELGKSQFLFGLNSEETVLRAAEYADEHNLWSEGGEKAKVICSAPIGVLSNGQLTNTINVYRKLNGMIHGTPGRP